MADFLVADLRTLDFRLLDFWAAAELVRLLRRAGFALFFAGIRISDAGVSWLRTTEMAAAGLKQRGPPPPSAP